MTTLVRTAASVVGLGLFLAGPAVFAQDASTPSRWSLPSLPSFGRNTEATPAKEPKTLYFTKEAATPLPPPVVGTAPAPTSTPAPFQTRFVPATPVPIAKDPVLPAPAFNNGIQRTMMQQPIIPPGTVPGPTGTPSDEAYSVQLEPPGNQRLFRLESERSLQERMRQEALGRPQPERIDFPVEPDIGEGLTYAGRTWRPMQEVVEAAYTCYGRLYFEERNAERFGWDLGPIQPFVSAGYFFFDLVALPYHMGTDPCRCYDCNSGYCLPGDPVPYVLYPPGLSVTGAVAEGVTWVGIAALFP